MAGRRTHRENGPLRSAGGMRSIWQLFPSSAPRPPLSVLLRGRRRTAVPVRCGRRDEERWCSFLGVCLRPACSAPLKLPGGLHVRGITAGTLTRTDHHSEQSCCHCLLVNILRALDAGGGGVLRCKPKSGNYKAWNNEATPTPPRFPRGNNFTGGHIELQAVGST